MRLAASRFPFVRKAWPWAGVLALIALWPAPRRPADLSGAEPPPLAPEYFEAVEPGRGREAAHPVAIPPRGLRDVAWRVLREVMADRLTSVAGGVTFFALLAIFPAIGVFVSLYGLFADVTSVQSQLRDLAGFIPSGVLQIVGDQMTLLAGRDEAGLSVAFAVSLLLSIWSANAGMKAVFEGLNTAYDETEKRDFLRLTAVSLVCTVGALAFVTIVTSVLVAAPLVFDWIGLAHLQPLLTPLRWVVLLVIAGAAFGVLYRVGPSRQPPRWRWVTPGAIFAAVFWLVGSLGFSWYVNNIAHYDATYGSLGAVIGFMVWIWVSVLVVLLGAEINSELEHQTAVDSTTGAPRPIGERGAYMADTVGGALTASVGDAWRWVLGLIPGRRPPQPNSSSRAARRAA